MKKKMQRTCDRIPVAIFPQEEEFVCAHIFPHSAWEMFGDEGRSDVDWSSSDFGDGKIKFRVRAINALIENFVDRLIFLIRLKGFKPTVLRNGVFPWKKIEKFIYFKEVDIFHKFSTTKLHSIIHDGIHNERRARNEI